MNQIDSRSFLAHVAAAAATAGDSRGRRAASKQSPSRVAPIGDVPFSPEGAGVEATVKARRLPGWKMAYGRAAENPVSPQASSEPVEEVRLDPSGCTNIRVTEFPCLSPQHSKP